MAGFPLPDNAKDYIYPLELKEELDQLTGGHRSDVRYRDYQRHEDFLADVNTLLEERIKAFHYLKKKYAPELFIFVFTCPDRVQHRMWEYMDTTFEPADFTTKKYRSLLENFWQHLDEAVGEILNSVGEETTVILMSDHGFGPQSGKFYVNQWLYETGYLKFKTAGESQLLKQKSLLTKALRQVRRLICHISLSRMLGRFIPSSLRQSLKERCRLKRCEKR